MIRSMTFPVLAIRRMVHTPTFKARFYIDLKTRKVRAGDRVVGRARAGLQPLALLATGQAPAPRLGRGRYGRAGRPAPPLTKATQEPMPPGPHGARTRGAQRADIRSGRPQAPRPHRTCTCRRLAQSGTLVWVLAR